jgi:hypothetical protein
MQDFTRAAGAILVMACVAGGGVGLLIGSIMLIVEGSWHLAVGSAGLIAVGTLFGNWVLDDEKVQD